MRAEPCEKGQLLAADQDIDRINLNDTHLFDQLAQMAPINSTSRPWVVEPLGPERNPPSLSLREPRHQTIVAQPSSQTRQPFQLGSDPN